jgi:hypothetical protein
VEFRCAVHSQMRQHGAQWRIGWAQARDHGAGTVGTRLAASRRGRDLTGVGTGHLWPTDEAGHNSKQCGLHASMDCHANKRVWPRPV